MIRNEIVYSKLIIMNCVSSTYSVQAIDKLVTTLQGTLYMYMECQKGQYSIYLHVATICVIRSISMKRGIFHFSTVIYFYLN